MEPELAADGCNWHTYGSWVLKALSEDDLMGYLEGSETRPTRNEKLSQSGELLTTCGNNGLLWPTTLSFPAYPTLENRYGPIPRPESLKVVDKAVPRCDTQPEQDAAGETAQDTCNSNDEPEYSPGSQSELVDSSSDCAEITAGHLEPETEIIDMQQVDYLPLVEVGAADSEMLDECTNALDAPESSSKTLDSVGNAVGQAGVQQQMPIEDSQCLVVDNETIANVPDPPTTHYELPTSRIESPTSVKYAPTRTHSATSTDFVLPVSEPTPKEPDKLKGGDWHDDGAGGGCPDSHRVRKSMPTGNRGQDTKCKAKRLDHSPAPPTPLPKRTGHVIRLYRVPRRRGRLKSSTESVSGTRTRQNAYHTRAGPMWLLLPLSTSKKRITFTAGGPQQGAGVESKMTKLGIRAINTKTSEMRGNLPLSEMQPKEPGKTKETGGGGDGTVSSEFADSHRIKKSMLADIRSQQGKLETKQPNGSPAPSKPTRNDFSHPPGTLRDPRLRSRIKTRSKNVSTVETRGARASILTIPISPPREITKCLWNVANTYWRHGIPPGWSQNVENPLLFDAAAWQQRCKARRRAHTVRVPKREVATTQRRVDTATARSHTTRTRGCICSSYIHFI